jgi:hypothetical protein
MKKITKLFSVLVAVALCSSFSLHAQTGDGLVGTYIKNPADINRVVDNQDLPDTLDMFSGELVETRVVPNIDLSGDFGGVVDNVVFGDYWSSSYEGVIEGPIDGDVTFTMEGDNGFRMYINDVLVLDNWVNNWNTPTSSDPVTMVAGELYDIRVEFFENVGGQFLWMKWSGDGLTEEIVPTGALFTDNTQGTTGLTAKYYRWTAEVENAFKGNLFDGDVFRKSIAPKPGVDDFSIDFADIANGDVGDDFYARFEGYIRAPFTGEVDFTMAGDDGTRLWIDETLVMSRWFFGEHTGSFTMTEGTLHKIKIEFYEGGGGVAMWLDWAYDGMARTRVPRSALYTANDGSGVFTAANNVPGTIEAEDYNTGGAGVAYQDGSTGNDGGEYRTDDVDIVAGGTGYQVTSGADEWLKYTVSALGTSKYKILVNVSGTGGTIDFEIDGEPVNTDPVTVPDGENMVEVPEIIDLEIGMHDLVMKTNSDGMAIDNIVLRNVNPYSGTAIDIPGKILAQETDLGGIGVAYWDNLWKDGDRNIRTDEPQYIDVGYKTGLPFVGWVDNGEWTTYTINVTATGDYIFEMGYFNGENSVFDIFLDGEIVLADFTTTTTGDWNVYGTQKSATTIHLTEGIHQLKALKTGGGGLDVVDYKMLPELSVSKLVTPVTRKNVPDSITVEVKSLSDVETTDLDIHYQVNDGDVVTETIASLAANSTETYIFDTPYDFTSVDTETYKVQVWTSTLDTITAYIKNYADDADLALNFRDNFSRKVEIQNTEAINPKAFTVEAWVYPTIMGGGHWDNTIIASSESGQGYSFSTGAGGVLKVWFEGNFDGDVVTNDAVLNLNEWAHVAFTLDSAAVHPVRIFVNGEPQEINEVTGEYVRSVDGVTDIGISPSWGRPFSGSIDEVRIWDGIRSDERIHAYNDSRLTGEEDNLVAYYRFNESFGDTKIYGDSIYDISGNGNDGELLNFSGEFVPVWVDGYAMDLQHVTPWATDIMVGRLVDDTESITIASNTDWKLSTDATWLSLAPDTSATDRNSEIVFTVLEENATEDERTANVTVSGIDIAEQTITVTQASTLTGIDVASENEFSIYPVPTEGVINFEFENAQSNNEIHIFNSSGVLVKSVSNVAGSATVDISDMSNGIYIVKVKTAGEVQSRIISKY